MKSAKIGLTVAIAVLLLAGCGAQSSKGGSAAQSQRQAKSSSVKKHKPTKVAKKTSSSQSTRNQKTTKQAATPWTQAKSTQLASFMNSWGQTMKQSYTAYTPGHSVNFYGTSEPDGMNSEPPAVNNHKIAIQWSQDGKVGSNVYALVAVYSDAETADYAAEHLYFFTIYNGQPVVLVTMQNQGMPNNYLNFDVTANKELQQGFAAIVNGKSSEPTTVASTTSKYNAQQLQLIARVGFEGLAPDGGTGLSASAVSQSLHDLDGIHISGSGTSTKGSSTIGTAVSTVEYTVVGDVMKINHPATAAGSDGWSASLKISQVGPLIFSGTNAALAQKIIAGIQPE
ncbi:DUF4767 domain-containing protein [Lacticaseibacillus zhaodongensis]|uniref:DUF4767 domain-containing protein n=1 Tax=Lacticaseibacillus zhaodongensis TaxID=2668065 RepID=UPI0012D33596|nr:DUF4767 domain-containing protein [Lacticaseibacillus zhaodongensis]